MSPVQPSGSSSCDTQRNRRSAGNFFQILSLDIIDFHLLVPPSLGVIGSQRSGFLKDAVRQLLSLGLYDHVGAGDSLRVKPPVAAVGKLEVEFFILVVFFPT